MLVKKSIHKVKNVIHKTLKNLRSLVSKGFNQNQLFRASSFNPSSNTTNMQQVHNFNRDMSEESCIRHNEDVKAKKSNSVTRSTSQDLNSCHRRLFTSNGEESLRITTKEERVKEENKIGKERGCLIAETMKELEMADVYNKDHVMDIEEALHYYPLITYPVYQDIVDRFFMDIYIFGVSTFTALCKHQQFSEKTPLYEALDVDFLASDCRNIFPSPTC